jgi:hypothetical protein
MNRNFPFFNRHVQCSISWWITIFDDIHLQLIFAVHDEPCKGNRIPAPNKDIPFEVHFPGRKIIRTARNVVMKLSEKYPYREIYEKSLP